jgi:asparagine synthetase B (glutamine-hydrolysing)
VDPNADDTCGPRGGALSGSARPGADDRGSIAPRLVGGWGQAARRHIERAAGRRRTEVVHDGPLTVSATPGSVEVGTAGSFRVWLIGQLGNENHGLKARPPHSSAAQMAAIAFDRLGDAACVQLHGAYVLVVLDRSRQSVRVFHDHLGARTVAYTRRGDDTLFAEHIVDLLGLLPATPVPDRRAVVQWIDRRTLPLSSSMLSGINRLPAGHALELADDGMRVHRYWRPVYREPVAMTRGDCATVVATAALAAVRRSALGLQNPSVKLSGGLDSACVAAGLVAIGAERRRSGFSCTFPDHPETDETGLINETADVTGLELVMIPYTETAIFPAALDYLRRWSTPPGSPNHVIWSPLMTAARSRGVDGLLDGEGGDELFGLAPYLIADRLRRGRLPAAWQLACELPGIGTDQRTRLRAIRVYGVSGNLPSWLRRLRRRGDPRSGVGPLVRDTDVPDLRSGDEEWSWKSGDGPLWWRSAVDVLLDGRERLDISGELAREAEAAGIERRHPFLHDARLIEAVLSIPPEAQFDATRDRPMLRDGLTGAIPEAVRTRNSKVYFNEIATRPLAGAEGAALLSQLARRAAPVRDYVRTEGLEELETIVTARGFRRQELANRLFRVASVNAWLEHLAELPGPETPTAREP